jgi:hypothetical protein
MKKILLMSAIATLMLSSCTQKFYLRSAQAQFTYPNSNVVPTGQKVTGKVSKIKLFLPPSITSELEGQAVNAALRQSNGADILINVDKFWNVTMIPLYIINLYVATYTVEGEAAKMTLGKQDLNN